MQQYHLVQSGPAFANFEIAYDALIAAGGAVVVRTAADISGQVGRLLDDAAAADGMRARAVAACDKLAGALPKTIAALASLLPAVRVATTSAAGASLDAGHAIRLGAGG